MWKSKLVKKRKHKNKNKNTHTTQRDTRGPQEKKQRKKEKPQRHKAESEPPSAVIFIPRIHGGELARRIMEKEKELNQHTIQKVKVIERNRDKLVHVLVRADPYGEPLCSRNDCLMCKTSDKETGHCRKTNIVYKI